MGDRVFLSIKVILSILVLMSQEDIKALESSWSWGSPPQLIILKENTSQCTLKGESVLSGVPYLWDELVPESGAGLEYAYIANFSKSISRDLTLLGDRLPELRHVAFANFSLESLLQENKEALVRYIQNANTLQSIALDIPSYIPDLLEEKVRGILAPALDQRNVTVIYHFAELPPLKMGRENVNGIKKSTIEKWVGKVGIGPLVKSFYFEPSLFCPVL